MYMCCLIANILHDNVSVLYDGEDIGCFYPVNKCPFPLPRAFHFLPCSLHTICFRTPNIINGGKRGTSYSLATSVICDSIIQR